MPPLMNPTQRADAERDENRQIDVPVMIDVEDRDGHRRERQGRRDREVVVARGQRDQDRRA